MSMNLAESIQQQLLEITNKKFSLKYIKQNICPIFEFINNSNKNKFLIAGSQGIGKSTLSNIHLTHSVCPYLTHSISAVSPCVFS